MYTCYYANDEQTRLSRRCYFRNTSPCMDFVPGSYICNRHMALFNLTQVYSSYHDCNNDQWSRVVLYVIGNVDIPLFLLRNGSVNLQEIKNFAESVKYIFPEINVLNFANELSCMMELSASPPSKTHSWLENSSTEVYATDQNGEISNIKLPFLHRVLFQFALPAYTQRPGELEQDVLIANMSLEFNSNIVNYESFSFKVPNYAKGMTLMKTDKENSIATPVILLAKYSGNHDTETRCFSTKIN